MRVNGQHCAKGTLKLLRSMEWVKGRASDTVNEASTAVISKERFGVCFGERSAGRHKGSASQALRYHLELTHVNFADDDRDILQQTKTSQFASGQ